MYKARGNVLNDQKLRSNLQLIWESSKFTTKIIPGIFRTNLELVLHVQVLSSQLVLAIEDLVKSLLGMLDTGQENGEDYGVSSTTEDESIRSFRSALVQSANTLDELTKLQISENGKEVKNAPNTENGSLFVNTASIVEQYDTNGEDEGTDHRYILNISNVFTIYFNSAVLILGGIGTEKNKERLKRLPIDHPPTIFFRKIFLIGNPEY